MPSITNFKSMKGKEIVLGVTGSIAVYKSLELVRRLKGLGAEVSVVMSQAAQAFVTPLSFSSLSERPVKIDLFDSESEGQIDHIALARRADLVLVAPATANFLAKAAYGLADDYLTTLLLATDAPVLMAPAMNQAMYLASATQENMDRLRARGVKFVAPGTGDLACGEVGPGRLAEVPDMVAAVQEILDQPGPLSGRKVLVTAGPTLEKIDAVRYISNHSSGKMGYALAQAALDLGAQVSLVSGPVYIEAPAGVDLVPVTTAQEMYDAVMARSDNQDMIIKCAAVADYRAAAPAEQKVKKQASWSVELTENPDILAQLGRVKPPSQVLVGFAAESEKLVQYARAKLNKKGADLIVANDISQTDIGFNADQNQVLLVEKSGETALGPSPKGELAAQILGWIVKHPQLGERLTRR